MRRTARRNAALVLAAGCLPALAGTGDLDDALRRCAQESAGPPRLACFDAIVSRLPQVEADRVGMTADIRRQREPAAVPATQDQILTAKISALHQTPRGEWLFTLDNRQVWMTAEARSSNSFAIGEEVHVEHGALTSLWLVGDRHRKVRVRRLQ
ncbi:MAG: hypothetical protein PVSMB6_11480 [Steroidobacteraceae bacterium]